MNLLNIVKKILNDDKVSFDEWLFFVEKCFKVLNKSCPYSEDTTIKLFQMNLGQSVLNNYVNQILEMPQMFGLGITKLMDKDGNIINQTIYGCS